MARPEPGTRWTNGKSVRKVYAIRPSGDGTFDVAYTVESVESFETGGTRYKIGRTEDGRAIYWCWRTTWNAWAKEQLP